MFRLLAASAIAIGFVAEGFAQNAAPAASALPQTTLAALGQLDVLNRSRSAAERNYRTAARNGTGTESRPRGAVKPFSSVQTSPTISPYLNLFREEDVNAAPNYHAFVRPQQDQYEANRQQQAELQQLQRQVQQATYGQPTGRVGVAGGARYGYTGRYYGGWRR